MRRSFVPVVLVLVLLAGCSSQQVKQLQSALVVAEQSYQDARFKADATKKVYDDAKAFLAGNPLLPADQVAKVTKVADEAIAKYEQYKGEADKYAAMVKNFSGRLEGLELTEKPSLVNALRTLEAGAGIAAPAAGPYAGYVKLSGMAAGLLATILAGTTVHQRKKKNEAEAGKSSLAADLTSVVKAIDRARKVTHGTGKNATRPLDDAMKNTDVVSILNSMGTKARDRVDEIQNGGIAA